MLKYYYDINSSDNFDVLFGGLDIGNDPTPLRNQFYVLTLDLSIAIEGDITRNFHRKINACIKDFEQYYNLTIDIDTEDSFISYQALVRAVSGKRGNLMVLIDEYDRYANKLMIEKPEVYLRFVIGNRGESGSSPIRSFLEALKSTPRNNIGEFRTFITGISPIALSDASGYNVAKNISLAPAFSDILGFQKGHLVDPIEKLIPEKRDEVLDLMESFYDGYIMYGSNTSLFSPTLSLYFLQGLQEPLFRERVLKYINYDAHFLAKRSYRDLQAMAKEAIVSERQKRDNLLEDVPDDYKKDLIGTPKSLLNQNTAISENRFKIFSDSIRKLTIECLLNIRKYINYDTHFLAKRSYRDLQAVEVKVSAREERDNLLEDLSDYYKKELIGIPESLLDKTQQYQKIGLKYSQTLSGN
eukprot:TRINITY_DN2288_c0_g1_i1.p1 TRINITY_DN2288_c0_g1~~TRINITY_DN2288_c0_g1_i1.p1  ORF type:complete len:413 (+),score=77.36 TRINITY_DN2288_c0_g1_i1:736-1974(+)